MHKIILIILIILSSIDLAAQNDTTPEVIYREVYFDYDIDRLSVEQKNKLDRLFDSVNTALIQRIVITGHTDSIGSDAYNVRLSKRRVDHVKQYLFERGIAKNKISADYEGERRPVSINADEAGRARNRRVELAIQLGKATPPKVTPPAPAVRDIKKGIIYGKITDATTGEPIKADLELLGDDDRIQVSSKETGNYSFNFNEINRYLIEANAPGYMYTSKNFNTRSLSDSVRVDIELMPLEVGKKFEAKNIYFYPNLPEVVGSSYPEMDKLLRLLQQNPGVKIEIQGHVNWPSTYPDPITPKIIRLSEDRARTVYDYLFSKGIPASRMSFVGKGNTEMVIPDAVTMEEYRKNMRVEILILER